MTDEEREKLVIEIADYITENKTSTRKTAQHFNISNYTVSEYMNNRLKSLDGLKYKKVQQVLKGNKPKTIDDKEIENRVLKVLELLKSGFTVKEIASSLGETEFTIYRDISNRLKKLSSEDYELAKKILEDNSLMNLNNNKVGIENGKTK